MRNAHYLIAGLGKTGLSIARYLSRRKQAFSVFDTRSKTDQMDEFVKEFPKVPVYLGQFPEELLTRLTAIIASPGVPLNQEQLALAIELEIPLYGDIECFAREVRAPVIAITGTNGKSTVTTLVGEMAKSAGFSVAVAGNIGTPVLDLLDSATSVDLWVLELSSFQLDLTHSLSPLAATILNFSEDHLDRHITFEAYQAAKQRIYHQANTILYNRDDIRTRPIEIAQNTRCMHFGLDSPTGDNWGIIRSHGKSYLAKGETLLLATDELLIKGQHNWENALAASALAMQAGISLEVICDVLRHFPGLKHRSQWVRTHKQVDWINDSKGTNVGATCAAISGIGTSLQGNIVLIAGGQGKGADFSSLRDPVSQHVSCVILIGEDADKIHDALQNSVLILRATTLKEAVQLAEEQAVAGDVVLLSPACASFDMFNDFNHRGESFIAIVEAL